MTRLFNKIDELIAADFDEYTATSLNNSVEQLTRKMEKISQIDEQLLRKMAIHRNAAFHKPSIGIIVTENEYHVHISVSVAHFHCMKVTHVEKVAFCRCCQILGIRASAMFKLGVIIFG